MGAANGPVLWTADDVRTATHGRCDASFAATGVSIDSRTLHRGDLFIALVGPNFDGHDFVADALEKGAAAAVVHRAPSAAGTDKPLLVVDDTMAALTGLGRAGRARGAARIVAVTGSVGKTGTKEALKLALGGQGRTSANEGSLNNHWGVPLSLARMAADADFGIFEMGMNRPGEIAPLSTLARPHVAVVTAVEAVHSAFFRCLDEITDAKAEVFAGMEAGGTAVLNRDNPQFGRLAALAGDKGLAVLGFGADARSDAGLVEAGLDADGSRIKAKLMGETVDYRLAVAGRHWVINSLAVLAAVAALGADVTAAARALGSMTAPEGRGRRYTVAATGGRFALIDESYNASPVSVKAAIEVLGQSQPGPGGRRIAVLGDMLELGADEVALHRDLAAPLRDNGVDLVFTAGPLMSHLWEVLPGAMRGGHAADSATLAPLASAAVHPGDVVTVKGSAASRTGLIVRALLALEDDRGETLPKRVVNGE